MLFDSIDDLRNIPDITPDVIAALRPHVSVYATSPLPTPGTTDRVVSAAVADFQSRTNDGGQSRNNPTNRQDRITASIVSEASSAEGAVFIRDAVVRVDPAVPKGYVALRWGRADAAPR